MHTLEPLLLALSRLVQELKLQLSPLNRGCFLGQQCGHEPCAHACLLRDRSHGRSINSIPNLPFWLEDACSCEAYLHHLHSLMTPVTWSGI